MVFAWSTTSLFTVIAGRIYQALDKNAEVLTVILDILNMFDSVWHADLHKLKDISEQIFDLYSIFLIKS